MKRPNIASSLRSLTTWFACLAVACGWFARPLRAQTVEKITEFPEYSERAVSDWLSDADKASDARYAERVLERFAAELDSDRYDAVLHALADEFRATKWDSHQDEKAKFQRRMDAVVEAFTAAWKAAVRTSGHPSLQDRSRLIAELKARHLGAESLLPQKVFVPGTEDDTAQYFFAEGDDPSQAPDAFATYRRVPGKGYELLLAPALVRDLRLRGDAFDKLIGRVIAPVQDVQAEAIRAADRQWQNYLFNGYSQYPWEALLNGEVLDFDAFHPPREQWILFHPTLGFEASTVSLDRITADEVIDIELLGYLRYSGADLDKFYGASLSWTLRNDATPGIGLVAHWTKSFSLGVTWRDDDDDGRYFDEGPYVFLSFDLYRYVQTQGEKLKGAYDQLLTRARGL